MGFGIKRMGAIVFLSFVISYTHCYSTITSSKIIIILAKLS